ncbi:Metallo-hydrolase/oxidoreductase [Fragilariopsis cylindrus CCMP1102]|uniref:Metallo-hydrolase/oxidoreductase n=1 Tax=Fragilariopsis cylindrus CCMP1102 TaxID=635003 RepID=A0A1E7FA36_9STRA|nr:Metallo-hydrolase/oxidoreductase [Fragilariopsis cylindrus CCMP1102]|eukprot:OEU14885.1 Metallo-hydrolase/oxidoreductase [Fragilariopsis cylindrus CCMP1102]
MTTTAGKDVVSSSSLLLQVLSRASTCPLPSSSQQSLVRSYSTTSAKKQLLLSRSSSSSSLLSLATADHSSSSFLKDHKSSSSSSSLLKQQSSTMTTTTTSYTGTNGMNKGGSILRASASSSSSDPNTNHNHNNKCECHNAINCDNDVNDGYFEVIGLQQLFDVESSTYTYLIWDTTTKDAIIIDPVLEQVDRDIKEIQEQDLNVLYAINTHVHADHITGTGVLKRKLLKLQGSKSNTNKSNTNDKLGLGLLQSVISKASNAKSDIQLENNDKIYFGSRYIQALSTPGHTTGCMCFVLDDLSYVFTGDTLLIQGCGRTDFQEGSSSTLWDSIYTQLFNSTILPDTTIIYPAHDYKSRKLSSIGIEKETNPRLGITKTKEEFLEIMKNLNLSYPKKMDITVPANMLRCEANNPIEVSPVPPCHGVGFGAWWPWDWTRCCTRSRGGGAAEAAEATDLGTGKAGGRLYNSNVQFHAFGY